MSLQALVENNLSGALQFDCPPAVSVSHMVAGSPLLSQLAIYDLGKHQRTETLNPYWIASRILLTPASDQSSSVAAFLGSKRVDRAFSSLSFPFPLFDIQIKSMKFSREKENNLSNTVFNKLFFETSF